MPIQSEKRRAQKRASYYRHREKTLQRVKPYQLQRTKERVERLAGRLRPLNCEICDKETGPGLSKTICFDHDHRTGAFRGWLCPKCNKALGLIDDNPTIAARMLVYLSQGGSQI